MPALAPSAVKTWTDRVRRHVADEKVVAIFERAMTDTVSRATRTLADGTTFVITGDIPAMWLRDSTTQMNPYLLLVDDDPDLANLLAGLVRRQFAYIAIDPYANAFNAEPSGAAYDSNDVSDNPWVWEQKYEIDSLAFPLQFVYRFWRITGRTDFFDPTVHAGIQNIVRVWRAEQDHESSSDYRFVRSGAAVTETLARDGLGTPVARTGMTWSGFRPSDDACTYGYNIPANLFAAATLQYAETIALVMYGDDQLAADAAALRKQILRGVAEFGTTDHQRWGRIFAYEVDGLGNQLLMDDANVPSLLSLPILGAVHADDPVYQATREFVLSADNPNYHVGIAARGMGSPHTPPDYIWPIALAVEGLTSSNSDEKRAIIQVLRDTDAGTLAMHEGFHKDDPTAYTREWFSWADAMFCELVLDYCGYRVRDAVTSIVKG